MHAETDSDGPSLGSSTHSAAASTGAHEASETAVLAEVDDKGVSRTPLHLAEFQLDERAEELAAHVSEGHMAILEACAEQYCLFKVVKNYDWIQFVRRLQTSSFRTSTSLLPPGGKGMRLFGQTATGGVGLVWDRRKLDLSNAFMWPSGYFAKSDYNVDADGHMENGRREALVTLEELLHANQTLTFQSCGSTVTGAVMPFNEVMVHVGGAKGLVGIFARSTCVKHLLLAMGIRALLLRSLPAAGELLLFVHDPDRGVRPFGRAAQSRLLCEHLVPAPPTTGCMDGPRFPLDTQSLDLSVLHQLEVHGAYGVTTDALHGVVTSLLQHHDDDSRSPRLLDKRAASGLVQEMRAILAIGLRAAAAADNPSSALALLREVAPLLCSGQGRDQDDLPLTLKLDGHMNVPAAITSSADFSAYLHRLAAQAQSPGVLVTVGATILLDELVSGRMTCRLEEACRQLEGWLHDSDSLLFRLRSWRELQSHHVPSQGPSVASFVTHKAITNRARFHDALLEIENCEDALGRMTRLHDLVGELQHPCLRLEMLQHIFGLNDRYDLKAVLDVATTAERILKDAKQQQQQQQQPFNDNTDDVPGILPHEDSFRSHQFEACALRMQGLDFDRSGKDFCAAPLRLV